ncbi:peroxiredoxin [Paraliomyxa miuraensis]|uniref:peroxiredoxin n=1 Tax=Paraliomyxa miuraensis TaxID=376150 RepID=UPI00224CAD14|nr:peroxiredoxin [Paraliomyxa miuraensis]MCX4244570.1 peroxiredoxin [Paraliomyxa miuraensis]
MARTPRPSKTASSKKASAKKASSKKASSKKASSKKASSKKASSKKASSKKASSKKASSKKASSKKASSKKASSKKASAKKASAKKASAKKASSKKAPAKKAPAKKAPAKKAPAKKAPPASEQLALVMDMGSAPTGATAAEQTPAAAEEFRGPLQPGDAVPDFSLEADDGQTYSRSSLAGQRFVLYFYPKDDTPGCTVEACDFRDRGASFVAAEVKVLGVSGDSLKSHGRFRDKYQLDFPLLTDPDRAVTRAFGALGEKKMYGKTRVGIIRSTFVVGPDGTVERTFSPVKVAGHAAAVLEAVGGS